MFIETLTFLVRVASETMESLSRKLGIFDAFENTNWLWVLVSPESLILGIQEAFVGGTEIGVMFVCESSVS